MIFFVSGEGPTDIGVCSSVAESCAGENFRAGPMAMIIDKLVEPIAGYSLLELGAMECVPRVVLDRKTKNLPKTFVPGKKRPAGAAYYFKSAVALAALAKDRSSPDFPTAAVLFHDADGTRETESGLCELKEQQMASGFEFAEFEHGVPMVPKPKSEAWLICALKAHAYQHCANLEGEISGNDNAPNSAKAQLAALVEDTGGSELAEMVKTNTVDASRIDMPSFNRFRQRLEFVTHKMLCLPQPT